MDIIGKLVIAYTKAGDAFTFNIDETASETDLRAEFALANREVEAIKDKYASGDFPAEMVERIAVLQGYKKAIREIIVARVDAKALLAEDVELPDTAPAAPAAAEDKPAPAPAPAEKPEVLVPEFVIDGDVIVDADGNRYSRVAESMDAKAAAVDSKQLEAMAASLRPQASGATALFKPAQTDEEVDREVSAKAPLLAALGGFNSGQDAAGNEISATQAGHLLRQAAGSRQDIRQYIARRDRFAPLQASLGLERIAGNNPVDRFVAEQQAKHADALLAAFCGPGELNRDQRVAVSTARPIAQALGQANAPIAIGLGIHEFFRAIGLADLHAHYTANPSAAKGIGQWNATDQAAVDTSDPATWKGCFTLPDCPGTVQVSAYFLWRCLRVTVEDQMSRPQYIDNITMLMEAMLARSAESALLATMDAWSFQRTVPNTPGMGAMAQLYWAVEQVMAWATSGSRIARSSYSLIVPEFLINMARIDAFFAGEDPGQVMTKMTEAAGGRLVVTPDWGAEGNAMLPMPVQPTPDAAASGNGTAIPLLPTSAVIRLVPLEDFVWGQTGVVDYGIETSPDLRRQNAALWFGEMAEIMYKNGGRPSFTLTLQNIVPNGARAANFVDADGLFAAGGGGAYNNTLPNLLKSGLAAAQYSSVVEIGS